MNDAPETIWARPDPYEPDWTGDKMLRSKDHVEYRRADLTLPMPLTTSQIMADPRVKALATYANHKRSCDLMSAFIENKVCTCGFDAALAQLKETTK